MKGGDYLKNEINVIKSPCGYIEICEMPEGEFAGRVRIKMSALEIVPNKSYYNDNGISWLEPYINDNIKSAIGMDYVVSWLDEENQIPNDHGKRFYDEDGNIQFEGVVVGSVLDAYIEDVEIDGVTKKLLMTEGYLNSQRYGKFVKWLKEEVQNGKVYGSIEINGKGKNKNIIYEGEYIDKDGNLLTPRVPKIYDFSALAILHNIVEPADKNSQVFEVNSKEENNLNINNKSSEGGKEMDEKLILELNNKIEDKTNEINNLKSNIEAKNVEVNTLTTKVTELETKLSEMNSTLVEVNKLLEDTKTEKENLATEVNTLKEYKETKELEAKKAEVNAYFENEIPKNKFAEAEVNSLKEYVEKCDLKGLKKAESDLIIKKFKELVKDEVTTETNSVNNNLFFSTKEEEIDDVEAGKLLFK
jgi:hypothetical protein